jgi:hypothetical protein
MRVIGNSMYGTKYAIRGSLPFNIPDSTELKWGDVVVDNDGQGMHMYVNECCLCQKKFLGGTLILISYECRECQTGEW